MKDHRNALSYYRIFCDLDGVLADFERAVSEQGLWDYEIQDVDWKKVAERPNWFLSLAPMPDFEELWDFLGPLVPTILTATPNPKREGLTTCAEDKREWVKLHLGADIPVITCLRSEKKKWATFWDLNNAYLPAILIDDRPKNIGEWIRKGGVGILHKDAQATIEILKELS